MSDTLSQGFQFDSDINKYAIFNQGGVSYGDIKNSLKEFKKKMSSALGSNKVNRSYSMKPLS